FLRTIGRGLSLFEDAANRSGGMRAEAKQGQIAGRDVFDLYTTYGFPPDLTRQMAHERGMTLDEARYEWLMRQHDDKSRSKMVRRAMSALATSTIRQGPTDDSLKWRTAECSATIQRIAIRLPDGSAHVTDSISEGQEAFLTLDRTCFYAESGGQVG